ncbi:uncharacterized protein LOC143350144 isoform X1 [Colletes latitarsis]|uniref:uncharacterized protein LOC143350144 isoform X1 n=1 Tax=Colletes latitarsis TaxID=2605962 RepID=UPI00403504A1
MKITWRWLVNCCFGVLDAGGARGSQVVTIGARETEEECGRATTSTVAGRPGETWDGGAGSRGVWRFHQLVGAEMISTSRVSINWRFRFHQPALTTIKSINIGSMLIIPLNAPPPSLS